MSELGSVAEEPAVESPAVESPPVDELAVEPPAAEPPAAEPPAAEPPAAESRAAEEPGAEEPGAEEPGAEERAAASVAVGATEGPQFDGARPFPTGAPEAMRQMHFVDVVLVLPATHPVVVLQEADFPYRELRIPVGGAEGVAIGYAARSASTPRPLTHELMTRLLQAFGLTLEVVRLTGRRGGTFLAEIVVSGSGGTRVIDCRPSDAIALALRQPVPSPIVAAPELLEEAGAAPLGSN